MKHLELFAGIGGFRYALSKLSKDFGVKHENVAFSEVDRYALISYKANYDTSKEKELGDIVTFNSKYENLENLPEFDLLTGGFPCQPFSIMGEELGFNDNRGNLFFEILKIVKEKDPKYILLENVRNLCTHDNGRTFKFIKQALSELGYSIYFDIFNTVNFHLAQTRNRVYIFATKELLPVGFEFSADRIKVVFDTIIEKTSLLKQNSTLDVLDESVDTKYYLSNRIKPTIFANGSAGFKSLSVLNPRIAKPLTATMMKMHRACQDNYFSYDFISSKDFCLCNKVLPVENLKNTAIRRITPWEALKLQGFNYTFFEKAHNKGVSDSQIYKQAGNAVSVNIVYAIFYYLFVYYGLS